MARSTIVMKTNVNVMTVMIKASKEVAARKKMVIHLHDETFFQPKPAARL